MATGYTYGVEDGTVTSFREFATQCSRAMGAAMHQRDYGNVNEGITEYSFGVDRLEIAVVSAGLEMEIARRRSDENWAAEYETYISSETASHEEQLKRWHLATSRYGSMILKVEAWEPPTTEHEGMKTFMLDQLQMSLQSLRNEPAFTPFYKSAEEYKLGNIAGSEIMLEQAKKQLENAEASRAEQNAWVRALYASLPDE